MDIYCFYIISYINYIYITTVYRSYEANRHRVRVTIVIEAIRVRIAQVVVVAVHIAFVHIGHIEVSIVRVNIDRARG